VPGQQIIGVPSCTVFPPSQVLCGVRGTDNFLYSTSARELSKGAEGKFSTSESVIVELPITVATFQKGE